MNKLTALTADEAFIILSRKRIYFNNNEFDISADRSMLPLLVTERRIDLAINLDTPSDDLILFLKCREAVNSAIIALRTKQLTSGRKPMPESAFAFRQRREQLNIGRLRNGLPNKKTMAKVPQEKRVRVQVFRCHCGNEFARIQNGFTKGKMAACCPHCRYLAKRNPSLETKLIGNGWRDVNGDVVLISKNKGEPK